MCASQLKGHADERDFKQVVLKTVFLESVLQVTQTVMPMACTGIDILEGNWGLQVWDCIALNTLQFQSGPFHGTCKIHIC